MRTSRTALLALLALVSTSVAVATVGNPVVHAASVPAGFSDAAVGSFGRSTAVEYLPSGQLVVVEQAGRIRVGRPSGPFTTAIDLVVCSNSERGALGFTHDPGYLGNGYVYVYYTRPSGGGCVNRVSRFQLIGNVINPASEFVLLDNISSINGNHNGGDLDFDGSGNLLVSVGDAGRNPRGGSGRNTAAQDLSLLNGKILRITRAGQPAPGNPISGPGTANCAQRGNTASTPTTPCRELFAWGLRNPYRIAVDRNDGSGRFFINDVGGRTREEVNDGLIARNYGWPDREGQCAQGSNPPCSGSPSVYTDPITDYGRSQGTFITAGAFTPNGFWPGYDGTYLFADGGSGRIWVRSAAGSVNYGAPFASNAFGLVDMTFGFDASGRMALYYLTSGGQLRVVTRSAPLTSSSADDLQVLSVNSVRRYDTGKAIGVKSGDVFNGTTRLIDLNPPAPYPAALVNITLAGAYGPGFVRTWEPGARRPGTASLNVDAVGDTVGSTTIVPLSPSGEFLIEATATGRVVVDVIGWLGDTSGAVRGGRYEDVVPARLVDTRKSPGTTLVSGSTNQYARSSTSIDLPVAGRLGVPNDGSVAAVVVSIAAIGRPDIGGFIGAHRSGTAWPGTSSVNVVAGDVRTNLAIVPLGTNGAISMRTATIADAVVDVMGYVTSGSAASSVSGLYSTVPPQRVVDTRVPLGFNRLASGQTVGFDVDARVPALAGAAAVVQYVAVTRTGGLGYLTAAPDQGATPFVSTVNFNPGQTRAALAVTPLTSSGRERFTNVGGTDVVVDVIGFFSD